MSSVDYDARIACNQLLAASISANTARSSLTREPSLDQGCPITLSVSLPFGISIVSFSCCYSSRFTRVVFFPSSHAFITAPRLLLHLPTQLHCSRRAASGLVCHVMARSLTQTISLPLSLPRNRLFASACYAVLLFSFLLLWFLHCVACRDRGICTSLGRQRDPASGRRAKSPPKKINDQKSSRVHFDLNGLAD